MGLLIGLNGYAGSGKSAVAGYLMGRGWNRMKFADPLKMAFRALLDDIGVSAAEADAMIEGDLKEVKMARLNGKSPRQVMQWLGQGARESLGEDFYVNILMAKRIRSFAHADVVVDDVRYFNESLAIKALGGYVIRIERPHVGPVNSHVSENLVQDYDILIENEGSKEDLADDVEEALSMIYRWEAKKRGAA